MSASVFMAFHSRSHFADGPTSIFQFEFNYSFFSKNTVIKQALLGHYYSQRIVDLILFQNKSLMTLGVISRSE